MTAHLAMDNRKIYCKLSGYSDALREDLLTKIPLRKRRWDGRRWIVDLAEVETLQRILAAHRILSVWEARS